MDSRFRGNDGAYHGNDGAFRGNDGFGAVVLEMLTHPLILIKPACSYGQSLEKTLFDAGIC